MHYFEERSLLKLIKNNPEEGLRKAMELYGGAVYTICKNILANCSEEDIEEAVSDCFLKLWKSTNLYKKEKGGSLKSYLYEITRNAALDILRSIKRHEPTILLDESIQDNDMDLENEIVREMDERVIHEVVNEMEEPDRSIFILRYFYFFKVNDIAGKLDLSIKSVENRLLRGKGKLKSKLLKRGAFYE